MSKKDDRRILHKKTRQILKKTDEPSQVSGRKLSKIRYGGGPSKKSFTDNKDRDNNEN